MLEMIRNSTNQNPEAAALFYDELARIIQVGGIDPKIEVLLLVRDCKKSEQEFCIMLQYIKQ